MHCRLFLCIVIGAGENQCNIPKRSSTIRQSGAHGAVKGAGRAGAGGARSRRQSGPSCFLDRWRTAAVGACAADVRPAARGPRVGGGGYGHRGATWASRSRWNGRRRRACRQSGLTGAGDGNARSHGNDRPEAVTGGSCQQPELPPGWPMTSRECPESVPLRLCHVCRSGHSAERHPRRRPPPTRPAAQTQPRNGRSSPQARAGAVWSCRCAGQGQPPDCGGAFAGGSPSLPSLQPGAAARAVAATAGVAGADACLAAGATGRAPPFPRPRPPGRDLASAATTSACTTTASSTTSVVAATSDSAAGRPWPRRCRAACNR